eukprot:scaffold2797_cov115-Skeletonema_marinoi.AAC.3
MFLRRFIALLAAHLPATFFGERGEGLLQKSKAKCQPCVGGRRARENSRYGIRKYVFRSIFSLFPPSALHHLCFRLIVTSRELPLHANFSTKPLPKQVT